MTTPSKPEALQRLASRLKACPSQDNTMSEALAVRIWERIKQEAWPGGDPLTPAVMAALILFDEFFGGLLNEAERSQMVALAETALARFEEKAHPPNKLGKILAASLKESK